MKLVKPIKSNYDMTPQEEQSMLSNATVRAIADAKEIAMLLIQKGQVFEKDTKLQDITKQISEAAKPIRDMYTERVKPSKVIS